MTRSTDLIDEVNILRRELEKLELEKRIAELKTEPIIDEGCVGCAGPCKVVDVYANLQKELDTTRDMYLSANDERYTQRKIIEDMRIELHDLKMYQPDNFWSVVTAKDDIIRQQGKTIKDFKTIETRETDRLHKIIDELKDQNIKDLKELYELDKADIDKRDKMIEKQGREISGLMCLRDMYNGLEAELSARKQDSSVLMNVVLVLKTWNECHRTNRSALDQLSDIVKDYLDTPEGPPETPIDEPQEIEVTFTFMEITQEE